MFREAQRVSERFGSQSRTVTSAFIRANSVAKSTAQVDFPTPLGTSHHNYRHQFLQINTITGIEWHTGIVSVTRNISITGNV